MRQCNYPIRLWGAVICCLAFTATDIQVDPAACWADAGDAPPAAPDEEAVQQLLKLLDPIEAQLKPAAPPREYRKAAVIHLDGPIGNWLEGYFQRKLTSARRWGADLIIVEIDSPGGRLFESIEITERLAKLSDAHTVAYIPHEAISGAAMISLGCDEIVMRPDAHLGDVGVIQQDEFANFRYAEEKIVSYVVALMRLYAQRKGRAPGLAEAMVDKDVEVFRARVKGDNQDLFLTAAEIQSSRRAGDLEKLELVHESRKGNFLLVSGERAGQLRLAQAVIADQSALKARYQVAGEWKEYRPDAIDQTLFVLGLWWVTLLLFVIGFSGILYEACAPGTCLGGLLAGLCFVLFFWSRFLSGTSGLLEISLFACGLVFLAVEIFVLPGFGFAGVTGISLILVSLVLACQNFIVPETGEQLRTLGATTALVAAAAALFGVVGFTMLRFFKSLPLLNRLILAPPAEEDAASAGALACPNEVQAKPSPLQVGAIGRCESPLRPMGKARFGDEYVEVISDGDFIPRGASIRIVEVSAHRIVVQTASSA